MLQSLSVEAQAAQAEKLAPLSPIGATAAVIHNEATKRQGQLLLYVAQTGRRARDLADMLLAFDPERSVAYFPPWDCLPFDSASPSRAVMGQRMGVLRWLTNADNRPNVVITTVEALLRLVPPRSIWSQLHREFRVGDEIKIAELEAHLRHIGYVFDDRVDEPGEAAIRGRVIDFFPAAAPNPCRVEYDGSRIVSIRSYDPATQRTIAESDMLIVDPANEIIGRAGVDGREHQLAAFYPTLESVFDYLGDCPMIIEDGVTRRAKAFRDAIEEGAKFASQRPCKRPLKPDAGFLPMDDWERLAGQRLEGSVDQTEETNFFVPRFAAEAHPWKELADFLASSEQDRTVVLAAPTEGLRREWARRAARHLKMPFPKVDTWQSVVDAKPGGRFSSILPCSQGFRTGDLPITVVTAEDIGGQAAVRSASPAASAFTSLIDGFALGDAVVHIEHGVGILEALEEIQHDKGRREVLRLRYADDATLMVPVEEIGALWRYSGETSGISLDKLKGGRWIERRNELLGNVQKTAVKLSDLAGRRKTIRTRPLKPDRQLYERFCARFPYELSPDQASATDAVLSDLASGHPMNRLICGDVGFGKTEIALRAAAATVFAGRQVAIIAATTVLAQQHARNFEKRFAGLGVEVAHLSRLTSPNEVKQIRDGLANGTIKVVVGTHALCGKHIRFDDLGLAVIDEEQRFGSNQKEALRELSQDAHYLSMTATPIPRTLQASFVGLNDLSVIATPPVLRQPIQTIVLPFDEERVRDALERERRRGGQSFVVCPRVEDIEPMRERLQQIVPDLRVLVAHGKLPANEIDATMLRFTEGDGDVLLATNIIESGLDVPAANTMIVWHPDRFGMAQLHQIRGRVGRGSRRGVAYLMTESGKTLAPETERRLKTLEAMNRLGAGFQVSARDLDLRGAGDLVGEEQAGHLQLVGLTLYRHLLERALAVAEGRDVRDDWMPEMALGIAGRIPPDYVPEAETRINLYAEIDRIQDTASLEALRDDLNDRFGPLPKAASVLLKMAAIRLRCIEAGIQRLAAGPKGIAAIFRTKADADVAREFDYPKGFSLKGQKLVLNVATQNTSERLRAVVAMLDRIDAACA
ncbi:transcription-repair coupling factor [Aureimonas jatrophae]|uniref:Transcription-repair-coupling factor n=1 Tax=Aureimonas jatrophae TaxID=1166073 RepID=A0A1H0GUK4_9HYPH|nr:DEAD/DEAH box helicase [Aureimonas jatrophae]MBB3949789.1 transcription-repair coupling factor (superfamily II helicase) [Aureimonas jatrophae]SDO10472.1 transcription-repair coupling factor (superfamily II helicase) [Aureimonas jatrophae]